MPTYGFENHTADQALISLKGNRRKVGASIDDTEHYEVATVIIKDSIAYDGFVNFIVNAGNGAATIAGYLSKAEAIYLRNRLIAFIEKGIEEASE